VIYEVSSDNDAATGNLHHVNKGWHANAHYIPPQAGARMISIKVQPSTLQAIIKAAICEVTGDALFITAYRSAVAITDYYSDILKRSAKNLNSDVLYDHFAKDRKFAEVISRTVSLLYFILSQHLICLQLAARLSNLHCSLKKTAAFEVKGFYNLIPGDACRDWVKHLISTAKYIYKRNNVSS
jgi:hypothetical protein